MKVMQQLNKESIKSLIGNVFVMQALQEEVELKMGETYKFEMKFTVRDEHLELEGGSIAHILRGESNAELGAGQSTQV